MLQPLDEISRVRWLACRNDSGEEIPGFAVVAITGVDSDGTLVVDQVTDADDTNVGVNGPYAIPTAAYGQVTRDFPWYVLCNANDGTPGVGTYWGTSPGSWALRSARSGFYCYGGATNNRALFVIDCCAPGVGSSGSATGTGDGPGGGDGDGETGPDGFPETLIVFGGFGFATCPCLGLTNGLGLELTYNPDTEVRTGSIEEECAGQPATVTYSVDGPDAANPWRLTVTIELEDGTTESAFLDPDVSVDDPFYYVYQGALATLTTATCPAGVPTDAQFYVVE